MNVFLLLYLLEELIKYVLIVWEILCLTMIGYGKQLYIISHD